MPPPTAPGAPMPGASVGARLRDRSGPQRLGAPHNLIESRVVDIDVEQPEDIAAAAAVRV